MKKSNNTYNLTQYLTSTSKRFTGIRIYKNSLRITSSLLKLMNKPEYINIYTDLKNKAIGLEPCKEQGKYTRKIFDSRTVNCTLNKEIVGNTYTFNKEQAGIYICISCH